MRRMTSMRIEPLNKQDVANGKYVLLLMRCIRSRSSPSFSFASRRANELGVHVLATFIYQPARHNLAQRKFLLEGLVCLKNALKKLGTPLFVCKANSEQEAVEIAVKLSGDACEVITDAAYLREDRNFEESLNDKLLTMCRRFTRVEGNVLVPVAVLCSKPAYNATSIRKFAWHFLNDMLQEKWDDKPKMHGGTWRPASSNLEAMDIGLELVKATDECKTISNVRGGEDNARQVLDKFIANKLSVYDQSRKIPIGENQSSLSAYIHFGMLSPLEIVSQVQHAKAPKSARDSFLEELVVRRELAHNFVYYYRDSYDSFDCLPDWAKKTMDEHRNDKREHVYSYEQLEEGRTHDPYWNAAQFELVYTHKMLGYLRMYWAKKVIEWSPDYESAYAFLMEQNDKYELDGRDPNGYCGVMWNFGMHDRAHANRPVLGKLRYMCADGLRRKFPKSIDEYVKKNYERAGRELISTDSVPKKKEAKSWKGLEPRVKKRLKIVTKRAVKV